MVEVVRFRTDSRRIGSLDPESRDWGIIESLRIGSFDAAFGACSIDRRFGMQSYESADDFVFGTEAATVQL